MHRALHLRRIELGTWQRRARGQPELRVDTNIPELNWNDVTFDYAAKSRSVTIVVLAGNSRNRHIGSPGKAWNVITVGGKNNQDTAAWHDDQMYDAGGNSGSAYLTLVVVYKVIEKSQKS